MVQVGQARLHGPSKAGDPQAVQVKAAPVRARDVRPDKLRSHRPTVGGVIDLAGMVSHHVYEPPAREVTEPVQARISPWISQGSDVIVLELLQRRRLLVQRPLPRIMSRSSTGNCRDRLIVSRELPRTEPAKNMRLLTERMRPPPPWEKGARDREAVDYPDGCREERPSFALLSYPADGGIVTAEKTSPAGKRISLTRQRSHQS